MPHHAAFHQGLHVHRWLRQKTILVENNIISFGNYNLKPLDLYNGISQVYYNKPEEEIQWYRNGEIKYYWNDPFYMLVFHNTTLPIRKVTVHVCQRLQTQMGDASCGVQSEFSMFENVHLENARHKLTTNLYN